MLLYLYLHKRMYHPSHKIIWWLVLVTGWWSNTLDFPLTPDTVRLKLLWRRKQMCASAIEEIKKERLQFSWNFFSCRFWWERFSRKWEKRFQSCAVFSRMWPTCGVLFKQLLQKEWGNVVDVKLWIWDFADVLDFNIEMVNPIDCYLPWQYNMHSC